jgi:predicted glycosyltransferase involved in capsule biosynthesis
MNISNSRLTAATFRAVTPKASNVNSRGWNPRKMAGIRFFLFNPEGRARFLALRLFHG